jgi:hypothetical protein
MSEKYNDKREMPEEDRKFYIEFGWLTAASVAIVSALELAVL